MFVGISIATSPLEKRDEKIERSNDGLPDIDGRRDS
jgi:hypothetical protein